MNGLFFKPVAHIGFHRQEIGDLVRVGSTGSRLQHESAILRMEHRGNNAMYRWSSASDVAQGSQLGAPLTCPGSWTKYCRRQPAAPLRSLFGGVIVWHSWRHRRKTRPCTRPQDTISISPHRLIPRLSTSSPQKSSSPRRSLARSHVCRN